MKPFFSPASADELENVFTVGAVHDGPIAAGNTTPADSDAALVARVAVYDDPAAAPRVEDVVGADPRGFIENLASHVYTVSRDLGGTAPYTVLRELVENLIHAEFQEIVVSILSDGTVIRFADQGPGIFDKDRALLPGFTTATAQMKHFIRGVGSGLPIVNEFLSHSGGSLSIEDNLGAGTVVTLRTSSPSVTYSMPDEAPAATPEGAAPLLAEPVPNLSLRQKKVLSLVMEYGEAGPTLVSKELGVGLSTAYRDLAYLEEHGLIVSDESGKRVLADLKTSLFDSLFD